MASSCKHITTPEARLPRHTLIATPYSASPSSSSRLATTTHCNFRLSLRKPYLGFPACSRRFTAVGASSDGLSTQRSFEGTAVGAVIEALQSHVNEGGKSLLTILTKFLARESELLETERESRAAERESLFQALEYERELRAQLRVELLRARGLNDTRGLFECLQENLAVKSNITARLKGAALWEGILEQNPGLAACIERCTNVPVSNAAKQALNCYNVFSILSQHVQAGKSLAELQVAQGGTIKFVRGPLSPEQVKVLLCIGAAAKVALDENTEGDMLYGSSIQESK